MAPSVHLRYLMSMRHFSYIHHISVKNYGRQVGIKILLAVQKVLQPRVLTATVAVLAGKV